MHLLHIKMSMTSAKPVIGGVGQEMNEWSKQNYPYSSGWSKCLSSTTVTINRLCKEADCLITIRPMGNPHVSLLLTCTMYNSKIEVLAVIPQCYCWPYLHKCIVNIGHIISYKPVQHLAVQVTQIIFVVVETNPRGAVISITCFRSIILFECRSYYNNYMVWLRPISKS